MSVGKIGPSIAILGASGLIGQAVADDLARRGFAIAAVARRFTRGQRDAFGDDVVERPFVSLGADELAEFVSSLNADVVVNCVGVLQDGARGRAKDVHAGFVARLVEAIEAANHPMLLVHLSIPGREDEDKTEFSRTKRDAERLIAASRAPHVILRPGFVIAPSAYGGSALIRALAALPFQLSAALGGRPFAVSAVADISATIATVAARWRNGDANWRARWDVMERHPSTVSGVVEAFRLRCGGPRPLLALPGWLLDFGAGCSDFSGSLGWSPPVRSTALAEMRRGVTGDPEPWIAATGIEPASLEAALAGLPLSIQERWFARLFLCKPLAIGALALFWIVSGLVGLTVGFDDAASLLSRHGLSGWLARGFVGATSILDIAIGVTIGFRRTCGAGLIAGIATSLAYLAGATVMTPELWADPLGPLVKIGPVVVLMLVALAILDDR